MKKRKIALYLSFIPYIYAILKILITGALEGYILDFWDLFFHNSIAGNIVLTICFCYQLFYFICYTNIIPKCKFVGFIFSTIILIILIIILFLSAIHNIDEAMTLLYLFLVLPILPATLVYFISFIIFMNKSD